MPFEGFPPEGIEFYQQLEMNNDREWWAERKPVYERAVRAPLLALAAELEEEFGSAKLFRPYRDTRFSADKSPYKTSAALWVPSAGGMGWYLQIGGEGLFVAAGFHDHAPEQVARFRAAVDDEGTGAPLVEIVEKLRSAGYVVGGDVMKTKPRGVPADHPRIELMRHRSLTASRGHGEPPWLATRKALSRVREDWREMTPLVRWLDTHVGPAAPRER